MFTIRNFRLLSGVGLLVTLAVGCVSGEYRRVQLDEDLSPGDVAYYRELAGSEGGQVEDYSGAFPLYLAPVILRTHETTADPVDGAMHIHSEDTLSGALFLTNRIEVANHDDRGKLQSHELRHQVLLGLVQFVNGVRRNELDELGSTGGFSLLWSGFGYERRSHGSVFRFLWIPFGSTD